MLSSVGKFVAGDIIFKRDKRELQTLCQPLGVLCGVPKHFENKLVQLMLTWKTLVSDELQYTQPSTSLGKTEVV